MEKPSPLLVLIRNSDYIPHQEDSKVIWATSVRTKKSIAGVLTENIFSLQPTAYQPKWIALMSGQARDRWFSASRRPILLEFLQLVQSSSPPTLRFLGLSALSVDAIHCARIVI